MCGDCGCSPSQAEVRRVTVNRRILEHNDELAESLRGEFARHGVLAVNVMSAPGSGKTEVLARTATALAGRCSVGVVTGDLATDNDARRLAQAGATSRQIQTGTVCHLEAQMVADALGDWRLGDLDVLFIENVGNMVCPADFDLGESLRVMVVSVTEGEDKPLKYPTLTLACDVALINKIDLAEVTGCDLDLLEANLRHLNPGIEVARLSARTGEGFETWLGLLHQRIGLTPVGHA